MVVVVVVVGGWVGWWVGGLVGWLDGWMVGLLVGWCTLQRTQRQNRQVFVEFPSCFHKKIFKLKLIKNSKFLINFKLINCLKKAAWKGLSPPPLPPTPLPL